MALDCAQPFDAQVEKLANQPGIKPAPKEPGEPYRFYSTEDGQASYMVTETGAPGHPAILMERIKAGAETISGCPYGDPAGYQKLVAYLKSLKAKGSPG